MQITLKCSECNIVFKITIVDGKIDFNETYYACCVSCGNTGYKALEEIEIEQI